MESGNQAIIMLFGIFLGLGVYAVYAGVVSEIKIIFEIGMYLGIPLVIIGSFMIFAAIASELSIKKENKKQSKKHSCRIE